MVRLVTVCTLVKSKLLFSLYFSLHHHTLITSAMTTSFIMSHTVIRKQCWYGNVERMERVCDRTKLKHHFCSMNVIYRSEVLLHCYDCCYQASNTAIKAPFSHESKTAINLCLLRHIVTCDLQSFPFM